MRHRYDQLMVLPPVTQVTKVLIITCVVAFFAEFILSSAGVRLGQYDLIRFFGLVPAYIKKGFWWQFVTYIFMHGNILHILLNMLILWYFGAEIEMRLGKWGYLRYFLLCGVGAGLFNYIVHMMIHEFPSEDPIIGASGAIYGILVAYGIFFGNRYFLVFFIFPMKAKYFVMIIGLIELMMGLQRNNPGDNVAHFAHLGGMVVGAGYIYLKYVKPWGRGRKKKSDHARDKLRQQFRLIVNQPNEKDGDSDDPPYWN